MRTKKKKKTCLHNKVTMQIANIDQGTHAFIIL
jgi:hypothetical protein